MSASTKLFASVQLGPLILLNRAASFGMVPCPLTADYYSQRPSARLVITEASQISQHGQHYQDTPGIYSKNQVAGWRMVTDAVHARGGRTFIQLWHAGRISHMQPGGAPVASSAIRAKAQSFVSGIAFGKPFISNPISLSG